MASGSALRAKVEKALAKAGGTHRTVQFRRVKRVGGNPTLGVGGTVTTEIVPVVPQPAVEELDGDAINTSGGLYKFGDQRFTFSGNLSESLLKTHQILYGDEVLQIVRYKPEGVVGGVVIAWQVVARTVKAG